MNQSRILLCNKKKTWQEALLEGDADPYTTARAERIYLIKYITDGRDAWNYALAEPRKFHFF
jgi:hypothetical protein